MKWCVMLEIETADPRIDPALIATVSGTMALRQAVMDALPRDVTRLVAVLPPGLAQLLMEMHETATAMAGREGSAFPPAGYKPPGDRR